MNYVVVKALRILAIPICALFDKMVDLSKKMAGKEYATNDRK